MNSAGGFRSWKIDITDSQPTPNGNTPAGPEQTATLAPSAPWMKLVGIQPIVADISTRSQARLPIIGGFTICTVTSRSGARLLPPVQRAATTRAMLPALCRTATMLFVAAAPGMRPNHAAQQAQLSPRGMKTGTELDFEWQWMFRQPRISPA